ncbi:hypothetical protein [Dyadobacter tibetensis]|uniref:hypothetical protein n=1 Tax=Dyadobacter tibetensis TaxID=1211851 RepID=UPI000470FF61|nr:hypothetical protein [Dyadobacter tibetensis]
MIKSSFIKGFFAMLLLCMACADDSIEKVTPKQELYFEVNYSNNAWGNQFKGFLINNRGQVLQYDLPAQWNKANVGVGLTAEQVKENLEIATLVDEKVDSSLFERQVQAIALLGAPSFSKRVSGGADRGTVLYYAYKFDTEKGNYTPILLAEAGDWEKHRLDPEAQNLLVWLQEIEQKLYQ